MHGVNVGASVLWHITPHVPHCTLPCMHAGIIVSTAIRSPINATPHIDLKQPPADATPHLSHHTLCRDADTIASTVIKPPASTIPHNIKLTFTATKDGARCAWHLDLWL